MNFQSLHYLMFLTGIVAACGLLWRHFEGRKNLLLLASYYFYMAWDWRFGALLAASTLLPYVVALRIAGARSRRGRNAWLGLGLAGSLGTLAYFKYANFFVQGAAALLQAVGLQAHPGLLQAVVPVGISFYTFQGLSYVVDVHRGQLEPTRNLRDFALFIAFFPTVLAGPITRGAQLLPQLARQQAVPGPDVERALWLVARGFIKKVLFSDVLASEWVDPAFENPETYSPLFLLTALCAYSFQIYMDVSGYTDIARGAGLLCGFRLPENFNRPYSAHSVSNFWQRWHISMSSFFRDYVFIGLGGSRRGNVYRNLLLTFLAIGLWHGGGWNFLLYGLLHGALVCLERWRRKRREAAGLPPAEALAGLRAALQIGGVFLFVSLTRVLFRASDLASAARYVAALTHLEHTTTPVHPLGLSMLALAALLHWAVPRQLPGQLVDRLCRWPVVAQAALLVLVFYLNVVFGSSQAPFVYFKF